MLKRTVAPVLGKVFESKTSERFIAILDVVMSSLP
jgi:hypothetical protein